jgi:Holliday junction resolvase
VNCAVKGRRSEHRARALLEAAGYVVCRSAASKGLVDLVAWNDHQVRFISVKAGSAYASALEREQLKLMPRPTNSSAEIWRFPDRAQKPLIERL